MVLDIHGFIFIFIFSFILTDLDRLPTDGLSCFYLIHPYDNPLPSSISISISISIHGFFISVLASFSRHSVKPTFGDAL